MTTTRQWLTILLLFSAGVLAGCYVPSPNYAAIVKPHAVILGFSGGGVCSGTIVGPRELLTASHCFDSAVLITVNDEPVTVITFRTDGADHTLLTLDKRFEKWAKVSKSPMAQGDSLFMYGNPRGGRDFYRRGYVIAVQEFAILDMMVGEGDSGAAVFNERGEVVGVLSAYGLNGHMKVALVRPFAEGFL